MPPPQLAACLVLLSLPASMTAQSAPAPSHPIDALVQEALPAAGPAPAPRADRPTLLRRASLALTGLPPSLEELDLFLADRSPGAFERAVERLLASPAYGEHQAVAWMDLARYADTNGYEKDRPRTAWPWRDWVIDAYQRDLPYDRFTVEQLAGDLLPDASLDSRIATGFHRNAMLNDEGGVDPEEFRIVAVKDRVDATARTWLALTLDCAQCHDHPNDPVSQREYYRFAAFFDSTQDDGVSAEPTVAWPAPELRPLLAELDAEERALLVELNREDSATRAAFTRWTADQADGIAARAAAPLRTGPWHRLGPLVTGAVTSARTRRFGPERGVRLDRRVSNQRWEPLEDQAAGAPLQVEGEGAATYLHRTYEVEDARDVELRIQAGPPATPLPALRIWWNGQPIEERAPDAGEPGLQPRSLRLLKGRNELLVKVATAEPVALRIELADGPWPPEVRAALRTPAAERSAAQRELLDDWWRERAPEFAAARAGLQALRRRRESLELPRAMVLAEREEPRVTRILERGDWTRPGEAVVPGTPSFLPPFPGDARPDRLGLARWLVESAADRVARVEVNRIWAMHFGEGLRETLDDFGAAGAEASHPRLLAFLSRWFREHGWSRKALHRLIVGSATWQQSSRVPDPAVDPRNRLLARGPRFRLGFEQLRDLGLAVSGLLHRQVGGPSVMPHQPPGIWEQSFVSIDLEDRWEVAPPPDRYRRGLYVYLRRTAPYPSYALFDGTRREVCTARRSRTITPLQTLLLWNDQAFLEAAGALGRRLHDAGTDPDAALTLGYRLCTARVPEPAEIRRARALVEQARRRFAGRPDEGAAFVRAAGQVTDPGTEPAVLAAWIVTAQTLLSLHETVTQH